VALMETAIHHPLFCVTLSRLVFKVKVQFFWNVCGMLTGNCSPVKMVHHPWRLESSWALLWECELSHFKSYINKNCSYV